jgi:hypothetical protein
MKSDSTAQASRSHRRTRDPGAAWGAVTLFDVNRPPAAWFIPRAGHCPVTMTNRSLRSRSLLGSVTPLAGRAGALSVAALSALPLSAFAGGCSAGNDAKVVLVPGWGPSAPGAPAATPGAAGGGSSGDGGAPIAAATGVPCDVAAVFAARCTSCHSDPPLASALAGLVSYSDLTAVSHEDPTKNEAQLSLSRMQKTASPMPPSGLPPAADVTTLQNWVNAGFPTGSCGAPAGTDGGSVAPPPAADSGTGAATDLPCEIAALLSANCTSCHSDPPIPSAVAGLVTYADLMATAHEDVAKNEAQLSLTRMQATTSPMPPSGALPATTVAIFQNWVDAGYPMGTCTTAGGDAGPVTPPASVFNGAPPFTPATGSSTHNAGKDCMQCHAGGGGNAPQFAFGGTLYDGSGKAVVGAEVRFVNASGTATSVYTGPSGTFYSRGSGFAGPAHVGVRNATSQEDMYTALQATSQPPASTGGACSACHCTGGTCTQALIHLP